MLDDPGLDPAGLAAALREGWAVDPTAFDFVPGYDMHAASYAVATRAAPVFLKVRIGAGDDAPLEVPAALLEAGVPNILAPIRTVTGALRHVEDGDRTLVLYPFVDGRNATQVTMTPGQWRTFGSTMAAVHRSGLEVKFAGLLPAETFGLASATDVRRAMAMAEAAGDSVSRSPSRDRLARLIRAQADRLVETVDRVEALGRALQRRPFTRVLCHADIHAANILVADDGSILLADWDGPILAPPERDLLFVIGSRIARDVRPDEERWFFEGYGDVAVDHDAIVYFRYERILQDIGEIWRSVSVDDPRASEPSRAWEVDLVEGFLAADGDLDTAERP